MRVMTYVVQVRDRQGRPILLNSVHQPKAGSQPALWGANETHGPSVFVDVEEGLTFCVNMQREFPDLTYHLIPANEVEVVDREAQRQAERDAAARRQAEDSIRRRNENQAAAALAFGRDRR